MRIVISTFFLLLELRIQTLAKVYNSVASLDPLLETQARVIRGIDAYLNAAKKKIQFVEDHIDTSRKKLEDAENDPAYFHNPITAFSFMNRVARDFEFIKNMTKDRIGYYKDSILLYPNRDDMVGAAKGIARMQTTYRMNITLLANGTLRSNFSRNNNLYIEHVTPLISCDCYVLGEVSDKDQGFSGQLLWMKEALKKYYAEKCDFCTVTEAAIVLKISEAYNNLREYKQALQWLKRYLALIPGNMRKEDRKKLKELQEKIDKGEGHKTRKEQKKAWKQPRKFVTGCYEQISPKNTHKLNLLKCGYEARTPFLKYAHAKEEVLSWVPNVVLFHDVISDAEIEDLKKLAKPKLIDDAVLKVGDDGKIYAENTILRISKGANLNNTSPLVDRLARRIGDLLDVNMASAMQLHVINYGIGGLYAEHLDHIKDINAHDPSTGDRLITFIYFLSDVEQGGALVFPMLGLKVYPKKGSAIAWSLLYPSGEGHLSMIHTACPVIRGSRWVAVNWSYELDQDKCPPWYNKNGIMTREKYSKWVIKYNETEKAYTKKFFKTFHS